MEGTQKIVVFFRTNLNVENAYMKKVEMCVTDKMDKAFAQVRIHSSARAGSPGVWIGVRAYRRNHKGRLVRRTARLWGFWNPRDWSFQRKATGRLVRATQTSAELGMVDGETIYYLCVKLSFRGGFSRCSTVLLAHEQDGVGVWVPVGLEVAVLGHEGGALLTAGREHGPDALEVRPYGGRAFHVNMFIGELENVCV